MAAGFASAGGSEGTPCSPWGPQLRQSTGEGRQALGSQGKPEEEADPGRTRAGRPSQWACAQEQGRDLSCTRSGRFPTAGWGWGADVGAPLGRVGTVTHAVTPKYAVFERKCPTPLRRGSENLGKMKTSTWVPSWGDPSGQESGENKGERACEDMKHGVSLSPSAFQCSSVRCQQGYGYHLRISVCCLDDLT